MNDSVFWNSGKRIRGGGKVEFSITGVTNSTDLVASYKTSLSSYSSIDFSLTQVSRGENQGIGRAVSPSGGSRGEAVSLAFPASRGCPHSSAHGPILRLQSQ